MPLSNLFHFFQLIIPFLFSVVDEAGDWLLHFSSAFYLVYLLSFVVVVSVQHHVMLDVTGKNRPTTGPLFYFFRRAALPKYTIGVIYNIAVVRPYSRTFSKVTVIRTVGCRSRIIQGQFESG